MTETFGEEVKRRRKTLGASQERLAELSGLTDKTLRDLERGARRPHDSTLRVVRATLSSLESQATSHVPLSDVAAAGLRSLRSALGLSQREVAERATSLGRPMHQTQVSKAESGDRSLSVDDLEGLSAALGVPVAKLLGQPAVEFKPPLGHVSVSADDVLTVLHGPISDPEAFMAAAKRLHLACLVDAEIVEEDDQ